MIKDHLKILDIDSALLVDDISSDFRIYEKSAKISLSILCFSLLLNIAKIFSTKLIFRYGHYI